MNDPGGSAGSSDGAGVGVGAARVAEVSLAEVLAAAVVVRVDLRVPFRGVKSRTAVILTGPCGWGEFAPFAEYGPAESSWWLESAVEAAFVGWPPPVRTAVGVNAIVPGVGPTQAAELAAAAAVSGARTIKIKVAGAGGSMAADANRVAAVRGVFGGKIRIDANGAWTPDEAVATLRVLDRIAGGLEYVEQPCADLAGLAEVRRRTDVPVAADESIRRAADPIAAVKAAAVDVVVLKVPPLGGVRRALAVAAAAGVPVVVSSAIDTGVGLAAGVAFAAALPELQHDCGLGTATLVVDDVVAPAPIPVGGRLPLTSGAPDPESLARAAARVSKVEQEAMLARLRAAWSAAGRASSGSGTLKV